MEVIGKALATIEEVGEDDLKYGPHGGFTCIASTPSTDRDGDNLYQNEWKTLPEHITVDSDHGMSVATTVGSGRPRFNSDGNIQVDVAFSSIARAQEVRTLVKEGHIRTVSVAFMTDKSKKSGEPRRELLNLGIVAVPANREAVILDSKALDDRAKELAAGILTPNEARELEDLETKDGKQPYGDVEYADPGFQEDHVKRYPVNTPGHIKAAWAYIHTSRDRDKYTPEQVDHIESVIRRAAKEHGIQLDESKSYDGDSAIYVRVLPQLDAEAWAKALSDQLSATFKASMGQGAGGGDMAMLQAIHDASVHMGAVCIAPIIEAAEDPTGADDGANKSFTLEDIKPEGMTLDQFKEGLANILTPETAEAPAEEEPAPAEEAAAASEEAAVDELALQEQELRLRLSLYS